MKIQFDNLNTGFVGDIVNELHPCVESNKESILIQLLACFGNCIGRTAYFSAAADRHFTNLNVVIVGKSSRGRKGQSLNVVKSLFEDVDENWFKTRIKKGLASGEGLIYHIKDANPLEENDPFAGTDDKRILCVESEFSSVLKMTQREGNVLSQVLRDCWDGHKLQTLTKNSPMTATDPMVSIIGHITDAELYKLLSPTEIYNGMANRFIFMRALKDKVLPNPEPLNPTVKEQLQVKLRERIAFAKSKAYEISFTRDGHIYWEEFYRSLNDDDQTVVGVLTARHEPQVRRLAMIISLMNGFDQINQDSLRFAEKIYDYSIETLKEIYGFSFGDSFTDRIFELLKQSPDGLSRTQIQDRLSRNYLKGSLDRSLNLLKSQGLVEITTMPTTGRPLEIWSCIST